MCEFIEKYLDPIVSFLELCLGVFIYFKAKGFLKNRKAELNLERSLKNSEKLFFELQSLKSPLNDLLSESVNIREVKSYPLEEIYKREYYEDPIFDSMGSLKPYQKIQVMTDRLEKYIPKIASHLSEIELILTFNVFPKLDLKFSELTERLNYWISLNQSRDFSSVKSFAYLKTEYQESAPEEVINGYLVFFKNLRNDNYDENLSHEGISNVIDEFMGEIKTLATDKKKRP